MSSPKINTPLCWNDLDICWNDLDFCWKTDWIIIKGANPSTNIPFQRPLTQQEQNKLVTLTMEMVEGEDYTFKQTKEKKEIEVISDKIKKSLEEELKVRITKVYIRKKD